MWSTTLLAGVGRRLREVYPAIEIIRVELTTAPSRSEVECERHWDGDEPKDDVDATLVTKTVRVSDEEAYGERQHLAATQGLLVGMSSAANVAVARRVARDGRPGEHVLTVIYDSGERCLSLDQYF